MLKFLARLFKRETEPEKPYEPVGRRNVTYTIYLPGGRSFRVVREDIFQATLQAYRSRSAS